MRALILAAGLGTRLRPLTYARAKAAVPVNGQPLVRRAAAWLVREGITDLLVNLHHLPASIAAAMGDGADLGARVRYSWEHPVLGSAGGPRHALPLLLDGAPDPADFLLVNGDTLTDMAIWPMVEAHRASGALVTMAVIPNPRPDAYGGVLVEGRRVVGFARRGAPDGARSYHFIGVQVATGAAFSRLPDGVPAESVMDIYPRLLEENGDAIAAHIVEATFDDIGTPADYLRTSLALAEVEGPRLIGADAWIHPAADVRRTVVWDRVAVEAGASLEECIVCDGVHVPEGCRFRRAALAPYREGPLRAGERIEGALLVREF